MTETSCSTGLQWVSQFFLTEWIAKSHLDQSVFDNVSLLGALKFNWVRGSLKPAVARVTNMHRHPNEQKHRDCFDKTICCSTKFWLENAKLIKLQNKNNHTNKHTHTPTNQPKNKNNKITLFLFVFFRFVFAFVSCFLTKQNKWGKK